MDPVFIVENPTSLSAKERNTCRVGKSLILTHVLWVTSECGFMKKTPVW
jgi:hypothetical protein